MKNMLEPQNLTAVVEKYEQHKAAAGGHRHQFSPRGSADFLKTYNQPDSSWTEGTQRLHDTKDDHLRTSEQTFVRMVLP